MAHALQIDGSPLLPGQVWLVARENAPVVLGAAAVARMEASRRTVEAHLGDGRAHYGINTGFGSLSRKRISNEDLRALQRNLVRSHAAGVGEPLGRDVVRGMMLLLIASLARGISGVRPVVAERLAAMLNAGVTPVVPETGSVGASGDLAPLAHIALALIGEGQAFAGGSGMAIDAADALSLAHLQPLELEAKEGLALINGTHLMAAQGALLVHDFDNLFESALVANAMSMDASRATDAFLDVRVYEARNQPGPARVAARLREMLKGSNIIPAHRENDPRVQDPYSLRCSPAVLGAAWDAAEYVRTAVARELGAVTDNPLVFPGAEGQEAGTEGAEGAEGGASIVSAGNFHGMPVAIPLDVLAIALAHVGGISERRTYGLLAATDSENPVPAYLSPEPGLHSGLMIAQYTAAAAQNELIGLCMPASVSNISTSAGMEDYNSFGPRSAAKARRGLELCTRIVAIELLCAAEALEYQRPLTSSPLVERAHGLIRTRVSKLTGDRPPAPDIAVLSSLILQGALNFSR